mgnify:CR=1 FL=1
MKKKITSESGITLVALAIIVVVLMILAGLLININDQNEGLLNIANQKKEETEILSIKEEIKTFLAENPPQDYQELITTLKNYGTVQNELDPENALLITNKGNYEIYIKDLWNVEATNAGLDIGDYVKFSPGNANYIVSKDYSGNSSNITISVSNTQDISWKVLDVDSGSGEIKLVPTNLSSMNLTVYGENGYNNIVKLLNDICNTLFSDEEKGVRARNINITDIEKIASNIDELKGDNYNTEKAYRQATYPGIISAESNENSQEKFITGHRTAVELVTNQTYYQGQIQYKNQNYSNILPTGTYWLSSRAVQNSASTADFYGRIITVNGNGMTLSGTKMYDSAGNATNTKTYSILPIIIINNNAVITDGDGSQGKPFYIK